MDALSRAMEMTGVTLPDGVEGIHILYAIIAVLVALVLVVMVVRRKRRSSSVVESESPAPVIEVSPTEPEVLEIIADQPETVPEGAWPKTGVLARLSGIANGDPMLKEELISARQLLDDGNMETAVEALAQIGDMEHKAGRDLRSKADERLSGAVDIHLVSGELKLSAGDAKGAVEQFAHAIETVPRGNSMLLAECLNRYGAATYQEGELDASAKSFKRAARILERIRGVNHPDVATAISNQAMLHYTRGDLAAAEPLYQRALEIDEAALGEDSHEVATDLNNLALLLKKQERYDEALPLLERSIRIKEDQLEPDHPSLITGRHNYDSLLSQMEPPEEAEVHETQAES